MAISITQISQGNDWVQVRVSGLDSNYPTKSLEYYIDGSFYDSYDTTGGGSAVQFVIEGLSSNTSYTLQVRAFAYYTVGGLTDWWPDPSSGNNVNSITISTASSTSAYFSVQGLSDSIYVQVTNLSLSNYNTITYRLYNSSSSSSYIDLQYGTSLDHTFQNLSAGTYYVEVSYEFGGHIYDLESDNGNIRQSVVVSGGGGGSPYYTYSVTNTSVTITIHDINSGYYYSFWITDSSGSTTIYDSQRSPNSRTQTNPFTITGLSPATTYLIKQVDYTQYSSGTPSSLTAIDYLYYGSGNQSTQFTTSGSQPSENGKVYIYTNNGWQKTTPYIYTSSGWKKAKAYIYTNSGWRVTN